MNIRQITVAAVVLASASVNAFAPQVSFRRSNMVALGVGGGELTAESIIEQVRDIDQKIFSSRMDCIPSVENSNHSIVETRSDLFVYLDVDVLYEKYKTRRA